MSEQLAAALIEATRAGAQQFKVGNYVWVRQDQDELVKLRSDNASMSMRLSNAEAALRTEVSRRTAAVASLVEAEKKNSELVHGIWCQTARKHLGAAAVAFPELLRTVKLG